MQRPLPVPFHPQKADGYCLPACTQMVLAYLGINTSQEDIAHQLGVIDGIGVPAGRIRHLRFPHVQIEYGQGDLQTITNHLDQRIPIIALVQVSELIQWEGQEFQHVIVIIGLNKQEKTIIALDPAKDDPQTYSLDEFFLAWSEMDYLYATLTR